MTELNVAEGLKKLREPFPDHQVSKLPKPTRKQTDCPPNEKVVCKICGAWHHPRVVHLDYVGHAALTDRLLDVDPTWNWEPVSVDENGLPRFDKINGLWIRLTVLGVTRYGYGDSQGKTGPNAIKETIGDALRNAAMRFGCALDLWHKGELHVEPQEEKPAPPSEKPKPAEPAKSAEKPRLTIGQRFLAAARITDQPELHDAAFALWSDREFLTMAEMEASTPEFFKFVSAKKDLGWIVEDTAAYLSGEKLVPVKEEEIPTNPTNELIDAFHGAELTSESANIVVSYLTSGKYQTFGEATKSHERSAELLKILNGRLQTETFESIINTAVKE